MARHRKRDDIKLTEEQLRQVAELPEFVAARKHAEHARAEGRTITTEQLVRSWPWRQRLAHRLYHVAGWLASGTRRP